MSFLNCHKAIFFDLDGVILDTESLYMQLMLKYNKSKGLYISRDFYIDNMLGKSQKVISSILKDQWNDKYNEREYWEGLLNLRENYLKKQKVSIKMGFYDLLDYLKSHNFYVSIVSSNSIELVNQLLINAHTDIEKFDSVITREDVKQLKPFPDLYKEAVKRSKITKRNIIAIEDSTVGLMAAVRANIDVIYVKDIANVSDELKANCLMTGNSLYDVRKFLVAEDEYKNGNNKKC